MKRSCSSVPQRISGDRRTARARNARSARGAAAAARGSCGHAAASRRRAARAGRGGPTRVRRVELVDAELRAVRVARHVDQQVPERPIDEPRRHRRLRRPASARTRSRARTGCRAGPRRRAAPGSSDRGTVRRTGTTATGDCASSSTRLRSRSGRRRNGLSAGDAAAQHEVIAAAGPGVAAVEHELLGASSPPAALLRRASSSARRADPNSAAGCTLTSITPGIRRDQEVRQPRIVRRRIAFEQHAHAEARAPSLRPPRRDRGSPRASRPAA